MADEGWVAPGADGGRGPFDAAYGGQGEWSGPPVQPQGQPWAGPYPQPPPPPRGRVRLRVVLGLLAVAALVGVTVVVALVLPSDGGGDVDPHESASMDPADVDLDLVPFRDPQGAYEVSVPEGWVSASLEGDISGLGRELFPDDPDRAAVVQQRLGSIPRAVIFMSLDSDQIGAGFTRNFTVVRLPGAGGGGRDNLVAQARQAVAGTDVTDEGSFLAAGREGVRVEYDVSGPISGVAYVLDASGDVWALVYTSLDLPDEEPLADAVAATFAPAPAGG